MCRNRKEKQNCRNSQHRKKRQAVRTDGNMALDRTEQESGEGVAPSEKKSKEPKKRIKNIKLWKQ